MLADAVSGLSDAPGTVGAVEQEVSVRVAFLGLGRMGRAMAAHVLDGGHELAVWNRTPGRAGDLTSRGARESATPAAAVEGADAAVLMLFGPDSVREVLPRVLEAAPAGLLVVNATTVGPGDAREFAVAAAASGARYVDAPVAGSTPAAEEGSLGVLVGASPADHEAALELLHLWGDPVRIRHVGAVGAGSALKLCVNQSLGVVAAGLGEALRLGRELGLERELLLEVLGQTPYGGWLGQKRAVLESDGAPTTFSVELMAKDLGLAVHAAEADLAVTSAALTQARRAVDAGHGGEDYATITTHVADEGEANSW